MKILIAADGSADSRAAIGFCRNMIVDPAGTSVKVLSTFSRPAPIAAEPFAVSAEYYQELEQIGHKHATEIVREAAAQLEEMFSGTLPPVLTEVASGSPSRIIVEEAQQWGADLIVLGSHGYGFWSRALLGSVSNSVLHHAPCSVLVVRNKDDSSRAEEE